MTTKEEQISVPSVEVMRELLAESRALVRLLYGEATNLDVDDAQSEACAETHPGNALITAYRDLLDLLEILSATSAPRTGEEVSAQ